MLVRCVLVLIMSVALGQTLKCYNCDPSNKDEELSSGPCKDSELGELVDCEGVCFKSLYGRWYFFPSCFTFTRFYKTMITIIIYLFIDDENKTISRGCDKKKDMENGCKTKVNRDRYNIDAPWCKKRAYTDLDLRTLNGM